jgi:YhcH/YjgK/YiaL family protein
MRIIKLLSTGLLIVLMTGCASKSNLNNPEKWSIGQASEWFNKKDWLGQTNLQVDTSFDKKEFAVRYFKNKEWWDKAFNFLKNEDLMAISVGVHELDSQNVFVKVTEYNSKNREEVAFEAHKEYSDIQYVVSGTEYIEMADLAGASLKTPYDKAKDIVFYDAKERETHIGKPGVFFLIFPDELHRSGIKVEDIAPVKKIVIKVKN